MAVLKAVAVAGGTAAGIMYQPAQLLLSHLPQQLPSQRLGKTKPEEEKAEETKPARRKQRRDKAGSQNVRSSIKSLWPLQHKRHHRSQLLKQQAPARLPKLGEQHVLQHLCS